MLSLSVLSVPASGQLLDKQSLLQRETFWDNRDWDWYREQIPFFECPDPEICTTYYYRWELLTKHLTYGSANSGYSFTEFIDRPFWSGAYGAISCPAGHQLYEARWLRSPRFARDYCRYWFRTPGAEPRRYSTWLADAVWAVHLVHPHDRFLTDLLPDLIANYQGWENEHFARDVGLFWQTGHDDGMEFNINSRQTEDLLRGAPAFRPSTNSYLWADAMAISRIAALAGEAETERRFREKADQIKAVLQERLWDPSRQFFFPMSMREETRDGHVVARHSLTYQSGQFAGSPHGRELIGYAPWQFSLPDADRGFEQAWKFLNDDAYFRATFGPTTVERRDPMFLLKDSCCWWSGQSWPYATTQTLKALANLLQHYRQEVVTGDDFNSLLRTYAISHRKDGKPYLAEALHPFTGSFAGHDSSNHSEHYFHSGFCDLVITGLIGLQPRRDDVVELLPLAPATWDYFALDDVAYHGRRLSIVWDRTGKRFGQGKGFMLFVDGQRAAARADLGPLSAKMPPASAEASGDKDVIPVNYAANNDGDYFPAITASSVDEGQSAQTLTDGNYWYHQHPPNRVTMATSTNAVDWIEIDLGTPRRIHTLKAYFLDDDGRTAVQAPASFALFVLRDGEWRPPEREERTPAAPQGRRANVVRFQEIETSAVRVELRHAKSARSGLTELEIWGDAQLPVEPAPRPEGNLAYNRGETPFPRVRASHTSRFDRLETVHDGRIVFRPTPANRWTAYESPHDTDWLEIDFGEPRTVGRMELYIYDDRGGVQAPESYVVQHWQDGEWRDVPDQRRSPDQPVGGKRNTVRFAPVRTDKLRIVFRRRGESRCGLTEIEAWEK